jgi:hypothetical protein
MLNTIIDTLIKVIIIIILTYQVHIDGYARIFGIFDEVRILASREVTQVKMVAEIHKSIQAHVYLISNYSKHVNTTHLMAKIIFKNQLSKVCTSESLSRGMLSAIILL